jgi:hypothetical protein
MFASAHIVFKNFRGGELRDWLADELPGRIPFVVSRTVWKGFATTVPQLRIDTNPVALTIQLDEDEGYVPDEISELASRLSTRLDAAARETLAIARSRLDVMSATPNEPVLSHGQIFVVATTDLDPKAADVELVLSTLSDLTDGFVVDLVNDRVRSPGTLEWLPGDAA